ncbi:U7 snRNA-associated Sm-like protein LSm11 [Tribolium castaneum]|uniref:U7 snRNA-associated Sm-like protein LSm11 n=1 Tax=Tribolium castaneum TaxID=7070 RepID=UPI00046C0A6D|nr:PREDICTED: U7 snRNA-associated Sm-like protein LSm11 [Tribolium castaneum]|eukprot:XP_008200791.1 PREDICTED: U7 snRNA-associated Sm-like protein LSm11 [Tribolium castaneum]
MASEETSNVSERGKTEKNKNYNPKLDFFSEQFDPLLALRTPNVTIPVPNAKTHDNIHRFKSVLEGKTQAPVKSKKTEEPQTAPVERRWLPHQLPIQTKRKTFYRNIFVRMENAVGPLQLLKTCREKRHRIKIWTRHSHDIRGYCLAYVVAFDKHWNLALEDVEEVWTRPKKRKIPALDSTRKLEIKPKVLPPPITIIQSTKKTETCSRHVSQLLLRGEHIAFIVVVPNVQKE